ncbi:MAG: tRNA (N6-isopentenyl adenosine(37)-C2)-methylthiotransferase MiaB, partial [Ruminococcus sp.]|nr:tRNA (N6-isopentenyl adenosine(37)-C2)-methylthiotransferase MiaB [Ruminococcus sp.]
MTDNNTLSAERVTAYEKLSQWCETYTLSKGHEPLAFLHSYGCQQNVSDGEKIKGMLAKAGFAFTDDTDTADLIILNTCAVRENAEDRVFGNIGNFKKLKESNKDLIIGICGCMAQEKHVAERIRQSYKYVDLVFGTFAYNDMYRLLWKVVSERTRVFEQSENITEINEDMVQLREDKLRAFVPIMYGCNNFCT